MQGTDGVSDHPRQRPDATPRKIKVAQSGTHSRPRPLLRVARRDAMRSRGDAPSTLTGKVPTSAALAREHEYMHWVSSLPEPEGDAPPPDDSWKAFMAARRKQREKQRLRLVAEERKQERRARGLQSGGDRRPAEKREAAAPRAAAEAGRKRGRPRLPSPTPDELEQQRRDITKERAKLAKKMEKAALKRDQAFAEDGAQRARQSLEDHVSSLRRVLEARSAAEPAAERAAAEYDFWHDTALRSRPSSRHNLTAAYRCEANARVNLALAKAEVAAACVLEANAATAAERAHAAAAKARATENAVVMEAVFVASLSALEVARHHRSYALAPLTTLDQPWVRAAFHACGLPKPQGSSELAPPTWEPLPPPPGYVVSAGRVWSTEGQCEGTTQLGERCKVHRSSKYAVAEPLRRGERFCGHHHPDKYTGVRCAGMKKHGKGQCRVWSGSFYSDAAPLRRGSPFCHHHRVRCAGETRTGARCTVTSSSEHTHAEPLRQGAAFCAHHQPAAELGDLIVSFEDMRRVERVAKIIQPRLDMIDAPSVGLVMAALLLAAGAPSAHAACQAVPGVEGCAWKGLTAELVDKCKGAVAEAAADVDDSDDDSFVLAEEDIPDSDQIGSDGEQPVVMQPPPRVREEDLEPGQWLDEQGYVRDPWDCVSAWDSYD